MWHDQDISIHRVVIDEDEVIDESKPKIHLPRDLSTDPQADLSCVLDMYSASFTDKPGHTDPTTHSINIEDKGPLFSQPNRLCSEWK